MQLGKRIKTLRENKGLSQTDLAGKIGVQPSQISSLESEDVAPWQDPVKYQLFADVFDIDARELWQIAQQDRREFKAKEHLKRAETLQPGISKKITRPIPILKEVPDFIPDNPQDFPSEITTGFYDPTVKDPNAFIYEVEGDFMAPEIKKGDLLLIYPSEVDKVKSGDIVVIRNNKGKKRLRRVTFENGQIILIPENSNYPVIVWKEKKDKPLIIGRVKEIIRRR